MITIRRQNFISRIGTLSVVLICLSTTIGAGQELTTTAPGDPARWKNDIQRFTDLDSTSRSESNGIVFVGSSTIRIWNTQKWFPESKVINRGFGGSQTSDTLHFFDQLVTKHQPRLVVMYAGTNDISDGESPKTVFEDYQHILRRMKTHLPDSHLVIISIKPTIARWALWSKMEQTNKLLGGLCDTYPRWNLEDVTLRFLGADGRPRKDLLSQDLLHLNESGYEVLTQAIRPHVNRVIGKLDIYCPTSLAANAQATVYAKIHSETESPVVEARIGNSEWIPMKPLPGSSMKLFEQSINASDLDPGEHWTRVRWKHLEGDWLHGKTILKINH